MCHQTHCMSLYADPSELDEWRSVKCITRYTQPLVLMVGCGLFSSKSKSKKEQVDEIWSTYYPFAHNFTPGISCDYVLLHV